MRSHQAVCLLSAKPGRCNRGFKSVPECRSNLLFCAPVTLYRQQHFDRLIFCPRSPTDSYKQRYRPRQWDDLGHSVLYGTEEGQKPSYAVVWGAHRTKFKEFWQGNLKERDSLKNQERGRKINWHESQMNVTAEWKLNLSVTFVTAPIIEIMSLAEYISNVGTW